MKFVAVILASVDFVPCICSFLLQIHIIDKILFIHMSRQTYEFVSTSKWFWKPGRTNPSLVYKRTVMLMGRLH